MTDRAEWVAEQAARVAMNGAQPDGPKFSIVCASDVTVSRVRYMWDGRIPLDAMTLMPGEEGIGKTTVGTRIAADLTRGTLPGEHYGFPQSVLVIAPEDSIDGVYVPRLKYAGADLTRVHFVKGRIVPDGTPEGDVTDVVVPTDLKALAADVVRLGIKFVWIDSLVTTLPDEMKSISYKDIAKVLKALGGWAAEHNLAVAAPWHLNKGSGTDTAMRIMDSRAFRTAVRSMLLLVSDPNASEGETAGILALDKANAGTLSVPGLRFKIRGAPYTVWETDERTGEIREIPASCGVADWDGEVEGDARELVRDLLAPRMTRDDDPAEWLREYLDIHGETPGGVVTAAGGVAGHAKRTLQSAAARLNVHYSQSGYPARTTWALPSSRATSTSRPPLALLAPLAVTGESVCGTTGAETAGQDQSRQSRQSRECSEGGATVDDHGASTAQVETLPKRTAPSNWMGDLRPRDGGAS